MDLNIVFDLKKKVKRNKVRMGKKKGKCCDCFLVRSK